MVTKDGKPWLCFGVMGGDMQAQGHVQVLVNLIDFGMNVQEAGDAARVRHDGSADADRRRGRARRRHGRGRTAGARGQVVRELEEGAPGRTRPRRRLRRLPGHSHRLEERRAAGSHRTAQRRLRGRLLI